MVDCIVKKYYRKGWLKYGLKDFSATDRFVAAMKLYTLYAQSRSLSQGVVNQEKPRVDGGYMLGFDELFLDKKESFMRVWYALPKDYRNFLDVVVLKDQRISESCFNDKKHVKKLLCAALDCLIVSFLHEEKRNCARGENE